MYIPGSGTKNPGSSYDRTQKILLNWQKLRQRQQEQGQSVASITFNNPTDNLAFFVHPVLTNGKEGEDVLPSFWSDNYFSLSPHQSYTVKVKWNSVSGIDPWLTIKGVNVPEQVIKLMGR